MQYALSFWATVTSFALCYGTVVLSVTLVYCGTEIGLGPGDIVLYMGIQLPPTERGTAARPLFGPCLMWPKGRPSQQLPSSCFIQLVFVSVADWDCVRFFTENLWDLTSAGFYMLHIFPVTTTTSEH